MKGRLSWLTDAVVTARAIVLLLGAVLGVIADGLGTGGALSELVAEQARNGL